MFDPAPYLAISAAVNRFTEVLKPSLKQIPASEEVQEAIIQGVAILLGILLVSLAPGLNLFVSIPALSPLLGIILTGAVVGLGAEFIDAVVDLLYSWQRPPTSETKITTPAGSDSEVSATVTTTTVAPTVQ